LVLPAALRGRAEFVAACRARDFAVVFGLVRRYGISQVRLAGALDMTASRVGEVIHGKRQVTSMEVVERISDRLRIPGPLLGLAPRPWEPTTTPGPNQGPTGGHGLTDLAAVLGYEEREITADAALRMAHLWLVTEPPQITETAAGRRIGVGLLHRVQARVDHLRRMDDFIGGGDLHQVVTRELDATAHLVRHGSHPHDVGARLLVATGELCQLAGWVLDDAGHHERAARHYIAGMHAAQAAGDTPLAANLLSTLSYQVANVGNAKDAVILARSALRGVEACGTPLVRALFWDRVAWAHARSGDLPGTLRALGEADEAYDHGGQGEEPEWVYWLDRTELDVMAGRCFVELNQPTRAEPLLSAGLAHYDHAHAREAALYRSWLAETYVKSGEIEQASAEATQVLDLTEGMNSSRAAQRLAMLHRALRPYHAIPAVRDFEERYRCSGAAH
jgi:plasmid maintenance system antidote protein VapI/tetratricopeptide (TPR) repeat protein